MQYGWICDYFDEQLRFFNSISAVSYIKKWAADMDLVFITQHWVYEKVTLTFRDRNGTEINIVVYKGVVGTY